MSWGELGVLLGAVLAGGGMAGHGKALFLGESMAGWEKWAQH